MPVDGGTGFPAMLYALAPHNLIAYTHQSAIVGGTDNIWVMNSDGSNNRQVTDLTGSARSPSLSPDGNKIVLLGWRSNSDLTSIDVIDIDGSGQTTLYEGSAADPAWSPNGTKIAFVHNSDVYVMNSDGTNITNITNNPNHNDEKPHWSPDSTKLVFLSNKNGPPDIYTITVGQDNQMETGSRTRITANSTPEYDPKWSPDGTRIAFSSPATGNHEIYVMTTDGNNQVNITNNTVRDDQPSWSRDGTKITFTSDRDSNMWEIYTMNADGTNVVRLTNNSTYDGEPSWSP